MLETLSPCPASHSKKVLCTNDHDAAFRADRLPVRKRGEINGGGSRFGECPHGVTTASRTWAQEAS